MKNTKNRPALNLQKSRFIFILLVMYFSSSYAACDVIFNQEFEQIHFASPGCGPFSDKAATSRFLSRATFGATQTQIDSLVQTDISQWLTDEFNKPAKEDYLQQFITLADALPVGEGIDPAIPNNRFMDDTIAAEDQLRERMIYALSQIIVVSNIGLLNDHPLLMGNYHDILARNAFGNYRQLLDDIAHSPAMAIYLTFLSNDKGNPATNSRPDENFARELMQLMSIGLFELNLDGSIKLDAQNQAIPTYGLPDILGLAKVFTGYSLVGNDFFHPDQDCFDNDHCINYRSPLQLYPEHHSTLKKEFLGVTIPSNTGGNESMQIALDTIFNHPNVAPFISKQLIQRFVTSNPSPAFIRRVATAFNTGLYKLPDGTNVGTGDRGDLKATIAAVLLDHESYRPPHLNPPTFGKVVEPYIRLAQWARAFNETTPDLSKEYLLEPREGLRQRPFLAPSVFNFYRPGYIAPNSHTGNNNLLAPELQLANSSSVLDYINFMNHYIYQRNGDIYADPNAGLYVDYSAQLALADNPPALLDNLNLLLTGNRLNSSTSNAIIAMLNEIPLNPDDLEYSKLSRVYLAISLLMSSANYLVQK